MIPITLCTCMYNRYLASWKACMYTSRDQGVIKCLSKIRLCEALLKLLVNILVYGFHCQINRRTEKKENNIKREEKN